MKKLTQNEILGLFAGIAVVGLTFLGTYLHPLTGGGIATTEDTASIVTLTDSASLPAAAGQALRDTDAVSRTGAAKKLIIEDITLGTGDAVVSGDTARVHYIGTLQDGKQFDNSYTKGTPFTFKVGAGEVIAGWDKGIVGMKKGGKRVLVIPSDLAYGNRSLGPIPSGSTLIFVVELIDIISQ